jgi:thioesterase domain-containing protein
VAEVEEKLGKPLSLPSFFQARTIVELAESLKSDQDRVEYTYLVALSAQGAKTPFFCVPPSATTAMTFGRLAEYMGQDRPFYGLEYAGMDGKTEPHVDISRMAAYYLEEIQSIQSGGPYYLGGMCFGGLVAFEIAQQLLSKGHAVAFLGILDSTHAPNLSKPRGYYVYLVTRFINQKFLRKKFTIGGATSRIPGDDVFRNRVQHVFASHNYARMRYRTTPYPGTITLFSTSGGKGQFSRTQWEPVSGKLQVITIPGTHVGHGFGLQENRDTFIREPHVQILAAKLKESITNAEMDVGS